MAANGDSGPRITFLEDSYLVPWEESPSLTSSPELDFTRAGLTMPIKSLGVQAIDETVGDRRLIASAVRYIARVLRWDGKTAFDHDDDDFLHLIEDLYHRSQEKVVYDGSFNIYRERGHLDTGANGWFQGTKLVKAGRIWCGDTDFNPQDESALRKLVFGNAYGKSQMRERLMRVERGIFRTDQTKERAREEEMKAEYERGMADQRESTLEPTF